MPSCVNLVTCGVEMRNETVFHIGLSLLFITVALGLVGYVKNIVLLLQADIITGYELVRGMGIVFPPLGAIMGFF